MKKIMSLLGFAAILMTVACNKEQTNMLAGKDYKNDAGLTDKQKKVLFLVIDGARGTTVRAMQPPVLWSMRDSAIYTWTGIAEKSATNGANWTAMLTGVLAAKNGVNSNDLSAAKLSAYPIFTSRLKDAGMKLNTAAFCASATLSQQLIGNSMDVNKTFSSDAAVKAALLDQLTKDSTDIVFAEFNEVDKAGAQYGYDESVPQYTDAIAAADKNIGDIMDVLRARKTYAKEDWLVIITSSKGGSWPVAPADDDGTIFSVPDVNTFTFLYNPRFISDPIARPEKVRVAFEGKAVRMYGDPSNTYVRAECNDGGAFNLQGRNMTFECKMKMNKNANGNYSYIYPPFLGKISARSSNNPGWAFFRNGNRINFFVADGSNKAEIGSQGPELSDGNWHNISGVVRVGTNTINTALLIDGVQVDQGSIAVANVANITSTANTIIGPFKEVFSGGYLDAYIVDVRIFSTAVPNDVIKTWGERTEVNKAHPYYANLIGYWPCLDGSGSKYLDKTTNKHDFNLVGNYKWDEFADQSGYLYPAIPNFERYVPNTVDLPMVIFNWMNEPVSLDWSLDAKSWPANFRDFPPVSR
ncbi:alkaline phosphatase family protein [Chitinophaga sp. Cy-1792]|uniref:alkaline phosphatase family protein n=1 Tax=Chitinophaga sp. Cy-1792 TaxID=2608339 RepID=UPI001421DB52|nr:alkaline phosphatase family protein [Chitinophaga sp. Cy-1792]NIG54182.1 DUF4983 domain-containing protein [Chitinophaga sp. Cy-1792]